MKTIGLSGFAPLCLFPTVEKGILSDIITRLLRICKQKAKSPAGPDFFVIISPQQGGGLLVIVVDAPDEFAEKGDIHRRDGGGDEGVFQISPFRAGFRHLTTQ